MPRASGRAQSGLALSALESDSEWVDLTPDAVEVLRSPIDSLKVRRDAVTMLREHRIAYVVLSLDSRSPFFAPVPNHRHQSFELGAAAGVRGPYGRALRSADGRLPDGDGTPAAPLAMSIREP